MEEVIREFVEDLWTEYDKDNSGYLQKEEVRELVQKTLSEVGAADTFSEDMFEELYAKSFDGDADEKVTLEEMIKFMRTIMGLGDPVETPKADGSQSDDAQAALRAQEIEKNRQLNEEARQMQRELEEKEQLRIKE